MYTYYGRLVLGSAFIWYTIIWCWWKLCFPAI